jgi:hypothetical protein
MTMKHVIYEDLITHKFALIRLPKEYADGDELSIGPLERWFATREEAVAALSELFNLDE